MGGKGKEGKGRKEKGEGILHPYVSKIKEIK